MKKGFTLVEVLVATAIMALLSAGIYAVYSGGIKLDRMAAQTGDSADEMRWLTATLTADMDGLAAFSDPGSRQNVLVCSADSFIFVRRTPRGLAAVRYSLQVPERTQIYRVVMGNRDYGKSPLKTGNVSEDSLAYLVRRSLPLEGYLSLADQDRNGDWPGADEECLSRRVLGGGLKFSYAVLKKSNDGNKLVWGPDCTAGSLIGVRVDADFDRQGSGQTHFSQDVLVPSLSAGGS